MKYNQHRDMKASGISRYLDYVNSVMRKAWSTLFEHMDHDTHTPPEVTNEEKLDFLHLPDTGTDFDKLQSALSKSIDEYMQFKTFDPKGAF
ncbi:MAG: hypothetical protein VX185_02205 [Pseudomonadota bacterium]|nr:hypothetical protein [Pseudomonadota bacterium]